MILYPRYRRKFTELWYINFGIYSLHNEKCLSLQRVFSDFQNKFQIRTKIFSLFAEKEVKVNWRKFNLLVKKNFFGTQLRKKSFLNDQKFYSVRGTAFDLPFLKFVLRICFISLTAWKLNFFIYDILINIDIIFRQIWAVWIFDLERIGLTVDYYSRNDRGGLIYVNKYYLRSAIISI